jgi:hypothetical protein
MSVQRPCLVVAVSSLLDAAQRPHQGVHRVVDPLVVRRVGHKGAIKQMLRHNRGESWQ